MIKLIQAIVDNLKKLAHLIFIETSAEGETRDHKICSYCEEEVEQLYQPPLLQVPLRILSPVEIGAIVNWHAPGSAYPGTEPFTVVSIGDYDAVLLPPETSPDEQLCYLCFAGRLWPALHGYVCNKPPGLQFNGWLDPTWA